MHKPFYGWVIVGVSFLIGFTESGVFQNILAIFMKPMVEEFGWSRASVTGAIAFGSICGGLLSLVVGPILDRYGPRMVGFWGILLLSLGLGAMTFATKLWQLYVFFGMGRMIAVGVLSLATAVAVANWFVVHRGRAMEIKGVGERLGAALLPLLVQFFILSLGWKMAWGALGAVVFLMSGIPALLFLRHRPEDMGLLPDGVTPGADRSGMVASPKEQARMDASGADSEPAWTRAQAMHTRAFWILTLVIILVPFVQAGINFHIYLFLTDEGYSETTAVLILSAIAVFGMVGSATWGMLCERFRVQRLLAANIIGGGVIFLLLYWAILLKFDDALKTGAIFLFASLHGIFHGGRSPLVPFIWADFFGRRSMGSIYGMATPFHYVGNALGPIFGGLCFDLWGSYTIPFYSFAAIFLVSGMITLQVRRPTCPAQGGASHAGL